MMRWSDLAQARDAINRLNAINTVLSRIAHTPGDNLAVSIQRDGFGEEPVCVVLPVWDLAEILDKQKDKLLKELAALGVEP